MNTIRAAAGANGSRDVPGTGGGVAATLSEVARIAAALLLVLAVVNPEHFPPWTSYHSEATGFVAGLLLLFSGAVRGARTVTAPVLAMLGLVALAWAQFAVGIVPFAGDAWIATAYVAVLAASWWWAASAADHSNSREQSEALNLAIGCLIAMAVLSAAQALVEWFRLEGWYGGWIYMPVSTNRSTGNIGQPNLLATLLLMGTAATAVLMIRRRVGLIAGWMLIGLYAAGIVTTQSRTALVSSTLMVASLLYCSWRHTQLRPWAKHAVAWLLLIFGGTLVLQTAGAELGRAPLGVDAMVNVGLRPVIWRQLLAAVVERPWTGYGWLQIGAAQQAGAEHYQGIEQVNYAHNVLLDSVVALGVPLAVAVFWMSSIWMWRRLKRLATAGYIPLAALFIVLPLLVHSQLELPHAYSFYLVIAGILFGTVDRHTREQGDWSVDIPQLVPVAGSVALAGTLSALAYEYSVVEEDFRVNRFENRNLGQTPATYEQPNLKLLTQQQVMLEAMRLRATRGMSERDLLVLRSATRRFTWAPLEFRAALAFGLNGRPEEAARHLRVITNMFPPDTQNDGRENWERLQEQHPELRTIPFPAAPTTRNLQSAG